MATILQNLTAATSTGASTLAVPNAATTNGSRLVIIAAARASATPTLTISGGSFTSLGNVTNSGSSPGVLYWFEIAQSASVGSNAFTVNSSVASGSIEAWFLELSGTAVTGASYSFQTATASGKTPTVSTTGSTTAGDLVLGAFMFNSATATISGLPGSPWTNVTAVEGIGVSGTTSQLQPGYEVPTSGGTQTYGGTISVSNPWCAVIGAYHNALSGTDESTSATVQANITSSSGPGGSGTLKPWLHGWLDRGGGPPFPSGYRGSMGGYDIGNSGYLTWNNLQPTRGSALVTTLIDSAVSDLNTYNSGLGSGINQALPWSVTNNWQGAKLRISMGINSPPWAMCLGQASNIQACSVQTASQISGTGTLAQSYSATVAYALWSEIITAFKGSGIAQAVAGAANEWGTQVIGPTTTTTLPAHTFVNGDDIIIDTVGSAAVAPAHVVPTDSGSNTWQLISSVANSGLRHERYRARVTTAGSQTITLTASAACGMCASATQWSGLTAPGTSLYDVTATAGTSTFSATATTGATAGSNELVIAGVGTGLGGGNYSPVTFSQAFSPSTAPLVGNQWQASGTTNYQGTWSNTTNYNVNDGVVLSNTVTYYFPEKTVANGGTQYTQTSLQGYVCLTANGPGTGAGVQQPPVAGLTGSPAESYQNAANTYWQQVSFFTYDQSGPNTAGQCPQFWTAECQSAMQAFEVKLAGQTLAGGTTVDTDPTIHEVTLSYRMLTYTEPLLRHAAGPQNIVNLIDNGYTSAQDQAGQTAEMFIRNAIWQNTIVGYSFNQYDNISNNGTFSSSLSFTEQLMQSGRTALGNQFSVDNNSIRTAYIPPNGGDAMYEYIRQSVGEPIGFQTAARAKVGAGSTPTLTEITNLVNYFCNTAVPTTNSVGATYLEAWGQYQSDMTAAQMLAYGNQMPVQPAGGGGTTNQETGSDMAIAGVISANISFTGTAQLVGDDIPSNGGGAVSAETASITVSTIPHTATVGPTVMFGAQRNTPFTPL
jgi:hypothetical protein